MCICRTCDSVQNKGKFREKGVFGDFWLSEMVSVCTVRLKTKFGQGYIRIEAFDMHRYCKFTIIRQNILKNSLFVFPRGTQNSPSSFWLVFHHRKNYLPGFCHFILPMAFREQKNNGMGCLDLNISWERRKRWDIIIGTFSQSV